jgi:4-hydroxybenzoate polyprenyltransferase
LVQEIPFSSTVVIGFVSFFLLNIGANAFNDYYDRDHGPLIGLEHPSKITQNILWSAWFMKISGLILAVLFLNRLFVSLYVLGVICSYVYSHKSTRVKSHPFASVFFGIGSGGAIFFAGALLKNIIIEPRLILGMLVAGLFLSSFHIITQVYETKDDKQRKDNTIAILYGKRFALYVSLLFFLLAGLATITIFSLMNLSFYVINTSIAYFIFIAYMILKWIKKEPESNAKDYHIVKYFIPYSVIVAYIVILTTYIQHIISL